MSALSFLRYYTERPMQREKTNKIGQYKLQSQSSQYQGQCAANEFCKIHNSAIAAANDKRMILSVEPQFFFTEFKS